LRYYQQIVETLRRNLNVAPARDVRDMAEQLRQEITSPRDDVPIHPHAVRAWPASISPPILAILPFRQTGADPLEAYLTAGLVSDLIGQLSVFRDIGVISHRSILGMRPDATDARVASDMLGVRYILAGTIRRSGASIRLSAELTDATTGSVLWSDVNDSGAALSFEMQDRLVGRVVSTLAPHVSVDDLRRLRANRPRSPVFYDTIMRVRQHLDSQQPDHWRNARSLLQSLIAAEPDYAEGHALLAECLGMLVERGASADIDADLRGMERATNAALMRDPNNLRALMLSAQRLLLFRRDYAGARALLATAVELYPSAALAWLFSALVCIGNEEADRAVAYAQHALTLSPYDFQIGLFQAVLSAAHYNAGNHRQAAEWGLRALSQPHIPDGLHRIMAALPAAIADVIRAAMSASSRRDFAM
jgi:adenylate cyclase